MAEDAHSRPRSRLGWFCCASKSIRLFLRKSEEGGIRDPAAYGQAARSLARHLCSARVARAPQVGSSSPAWSQSQVFLSLVPPSYALPPGTGREIVVQSLS